MKRIFPPVLGIALLLLLNSCGINSAMMVHQNQNSTQVHLTSNNYRVVEKVSGSAEVEYILLIGGMNRTQLYKSAYADMVNKTDLTAGSKALINIVTEDHIGGVPPFYYKRTITVSAHVIEFTK